MLDSSDSDVEGFPDGSFDVGVVPRQNDTADSESDISLGEDLSDEEDGRGTSVGDAGDAGMFSERLSNINIPQFAEPTGPRHTFLSRQFLGASIFDVSVHR